MPLILFLMVLIIAGGMLLFWLGFSTTLSSRAQNAADAAALAGEKELVTELENPPVGKLTPGFSTTTVCLKADGYAQRNSAHVTACDPVSSANSTVGWDVQVKVQGDTSLPASSPASGDAASASARASTDPFAQASPAIQQGSPCTEASLGGGAQFQPHGGQYGFFPAAGTDYSHGCEPRLAGALDQLAIALQLHLVGAAGYVSTTAQASTSNGPAASLHACGAASTTQGLGSVSDTVLAQHGLTRPFPGQPDEVELIDQGCQSVDSSASPPVGVGNLNVHLVALEGGPAGSFLSVVGGGSSSIGQSALQVGCQIYRAWQGLNIGRYANEALQIALLVASDESAFGQNIGPNRSDPSASIGVFQQISVDGWGTPSEELNATAILFFVGGHSPNGASAQGLLPNLQADPSLPIWQLAQQTQGSGAGSGTNGLGNYGTGANQAAEQAMYNQVTGGACKGA